MRREGVILDAVAYICLLKACAAVGAVDKEKEIYEVIAKEGLLQDNVMLATILVDMYAKCGALAKARRVLEELCSWNVLSAGYAQDGQGEQALNCFEQMQCEGILPDAVTYTCTLKPSVAIRDADKGKLVHDMITIQGLLKNDIKLGTAPVYMYAKCGVLSKGKCALKELSYHDVVT